MALAIASSARAQVSEEPAKQHFRNGVKLYQDGNYSGALVEFEAAYRNKPSAAALQNTALAQKALFRYAAASDTLQRLLEVHGAELGKDDRAAVEDALKELNSLLGSIVVRVSPPEARVTLDGKNLEPSDLGRSLRLDVGEHTLVADAPGYARATQAVRITGGQRDVPVLLALEPTSGFIKVESDEPAAAIAIDGKPVGYHRWHGPVPPGRHYVQAYKPGGESFGRFVQVGLGKTHEIRAVLGAPGEAPAVSPEISAETAPAQRGWYGLLGLTALGFEAVPRGFDADQSKASGASLSLRGGYRILPWFGAELMLEGVRHTGAVCGPGINDCGSDDVSDYELGTLRVGPNARFMTTGRVLRFISTAGFGLARHSFKLVEGSGPGGTDQWGGSGAYLLLEVGGQLNLGHFLLELDLVAAIDSIASLNNKAPEGEGMVPRDAYKYEDDSLTMVGLGIRGGFGQWKPK